MFARWTFLFNSGIAKAVFILLTLSLLSSTPATSMFDSNHIETLESYEDLWSKTLEDPMQNLTFRFTCENKPAGFYADVDHDCRIFHICTDHGNETPVLCPYNTKFDQRQGMCSDEKFNCKISERWYFMSPSNYYTYFKENVEDEEDEKFEFVPLPPN